jgi:hypothetical protein
MSDITKKSSPALILFAWIVVSVPLAWGLYRSVKNARPLFSGATQAAPSATQAAPAASPK